MPRKSKKVTQRVRANIHEGPGTANLRQPGTEAKNIPARPTVGLLPVTFKPKRSWQIHDEDVFTRYEEMWNDLLPAYQGYCKRAGLKPKQIKSEHTAEKLLTIFNHLKDVVYKLNREATLDIDSEVNDDEVREYYFVIHREFPMNYTLYAFPLLFLYNLEETRNPLFSYAIRFSKLFLNRLGFIDWEDGRMAYMSEMLTEWANERASEGEESEAEEIIGDVLKYQYGLAVEWLNKLYGAGPFNKRHVRELRRKHFKDDFTEFLRRWMLRGYQLVTSKDSRRIMDMEYRVDPSMTTDEYMDAIEFYGSPVQLHDLFIIAWADDDHMVTAHLQDLEAISNEFGSNNPTEVRYILKKGRGIYKPSDWFKELKEWLDEGFGAISKYNEKRIKITDNNEQSDRAVASDIQP